MTFDDTVNIGSLVVQSIRYGQPTQFHARSRVEDDPHAGNPEHL